MQAAPLAGDRIWATLGDACVPAGDTVSRACLRVVQISLAAGTPAVVDDVDAGLAGIDMYYPETHMASLRGLNTPRSNAASKSLH